MTMYGEESFLVPYVNSGCPVYFSGGLHKFGYTNRLRTRYTTETVVLSKTGNVFVRSTSSTPYFRLVDILLIRLAPYVLKNYMLGNAVKAVSRIPPPASAASESFTFSALAEAGYSDDSKKLLGLFHTVGTHPPFLFDGNGNRLDPPREDRKGLFDVGRYKLTLLGNLFDALRKKGVYDISTIIIAADHGCRLMKDGDHHPGYESSILWIKPRGASSPFQHDAAPTSNCRVSAIVKELLKNDLTIDEMKKLLIQKERIVRDEFHGVTKASLGLGKIHYDDWIFGSDGKLIRKEQH